MQSSTLAAVLALLKVPEGQSKQRASSRYWPRAHGWHASGDEAPPSVVLDPGGQDVQFFEAPLPEYLPRGHARHCASLTPPEEERYFPASHTAHAAIPGDSAYDPNAHFSHVLGSVAAFAALALPGTH